MHFLIVQIICDIKSRKVNEMPFANISVVIVRLSLIRKTILIPEY